MVRTFTAGVRTFVLFPLFFLFTVIVAIFIVVAGIVRSKTPTYGGLLRYWARMFLRIAPVEYEIVGADVLDPTAQYVVIANHLSMFDIPLLFAALPIDVRFLAKTEVFKIPFVGSAMRTIGIIEVDRSSASRARVAVQNAITLAGERGHSLIVFPEGTRGNGEEMLPFKKGAFRIAMDAELPVLPIVIVGTDRVSKPGSKLFFPGRATVYILNPVGTASLTTKDLRNLAADVRTSMVATYDAAGQS